MSTFEKFNFHSLEELKQKLAQEGISIALSEDLSAFARTVKIGRRTAPNAFAILPMEGCDCALDGAPSELTLRRYMRFARGGAGLIWFEACAVTPEGKANERSMALNRDNLSSFRKMLDMVRAEARAQNGAGREPLCILQLTHSGRYSRPVGHVSAPMIAVHDPLLDPPVGLKGHEPVLSDGYLDELQERYVEAALLAQEAGFDGVDIKACHRYLVSELLSARKREGRYGGSFENRSRMLLETISKVRAALDPGTIVACRFNVYDAHPYPYGFGVDRDDFMKYDLTEPLELVRCLCAAGVDLLSNSSGNPYYRYPQFTRPFDTPTLQGEIPPEHPLESVARLFELSASVQRAAGDVPVVGNGYSWLRSFIPYAGAANLQSGRISMVGLGRAGIAYPDAPNDVLSGSGMQPEKCCITCSRCTQMMRDHGRDGCVVRDAEVYARLYQESRADAVQRDGK